MKLPFLPIPTNSPIRTVIFSSSDSLLFIPQLKSYRDFKVFPKPFIHPSFQWLREEGSSLALTPLSLSGTCSSDDRKSRGRNLTLGCSGRDCLCLSLAMASGHSVDKMVASIVSPETKLTVKFSPWLPSNWGAHSTFLSWGASLPCCGSPTRLPPVSPALCS